MPPGPPKALMPDDFVYCVRFCEFLLVEGLPKQAELVFQMIAY